MCLVAACAIFTILFQAFINKTVPLSFFIGVFIGMLIGMPIVFAFFWLAFKTIKCKSCGNILHPFRKPANLRQILFGGWTCPHCKKEIDRKGNLIV